MNDIFIEQLIKRKRRVKDNVLFILTIMFVVLTPIVLAALAVNKLLSAYFIYISLFILVIGIWLIWFVRSNQNVEFEYQMIQDTLVVSKITAKRKRKLVLKIDVKNFDILDKGNDDNVSKMKFTKVYEACADVGDEENTYYAVYNHTAYGRCALLFNPNEKVLNSMRPYLKKDVVLKLFHKRG